MSMQGKTVVATGATSGIGEAGVVALARQGARVVFVARDEARAQATLAKLEAAGPGLGHTRHIADLSTIAATRQVGLAIAASEPRIDVLINNAGAMYSTRQLTADGLELTFALNHMAYFVLTATLRETLVASAPARIVSTASAAHQGSLDFNDLQAASGFNGLAAYAHSKLANILFTRELARRLAGAGVTANCFHPGAVSTRFGDSAVGLTSALIPLLRPFFTTPEKGADTLVYLATSPDVAATSGEYFVNRKVAQPSAAARNDDDARRLWDVSERLAAASAKTGEAA